MRTLHIVQGDAEDDKTQLEKKAKGKLIHTTSWICPKSARPGDDVILYVPTYGFFATAIIRSLPEPRHDWHNRYGAPLTSVRLINPAISLAAIRKHIPELKWAIYPRSITTPTPDVATKIRNLIHMRRKNHFDCAEDVLLNSNIDELRRIALLKAKRTATPKERNTNYRVRSSAIKLYVLLRSKGICEGCGKPAPFKKIDGSPYLEPHHIKKLADDGPDHPNFVIALCPNCHRKAHYAANAEGLKKILLKKMSVLETE